MSMFKLQMKLFALVPEANCLMKIIKQITVMQSSGSDVVIFHRDSLQD